MNGLRIFRLGLFQMAAGGFSVLFLGVLNRVMRVELGMELFLVTLLVGGGHYLGALIAIPFGYASDRTPVFGFRRSVYILLGAIGTMLVLVTSLSVARWLAADPTGPRLLFGFLFFLLEGMATYMSGTAFLALITDLSRSEERGRITGLVWTMLMVGIIATGIFSGIALEDFSLVRVQGLFRVAGLAGLVLALIAIIGQERSVHDFTPPRSQSLPLALGKLFSNVQARAFGGFLFLSMFAYFMQDVLLEPFGGEVFGLSPAETTRFNAYMGIGVITAMLLGGSRLIPRHGKRWTTALGVWIMIFAFSGLALSAFSGASSGLPILILAIGTGAGFFTVGGVALMMDMTSTAQTGLFVGAWTLVQAVAKGPTAIVGGALQTWFTRTGASPAMAYGGVFLIEAVGLLLSLVLLRRVAVVEFKASVEPENIAMLEMLGS
jgi:BCD family chlorophyll transporter-like MFS transporter